MKKLFYLIVVLLLSLSSFAQNPNTFNYQAVIRDVSGGILANKAVSVKLEIIKGKTTKTVVYTETWDVQTNLLGLINVEVGAGNPANFAKIDWTAGPFSLAVSVDGELLGKSPMLSVPFAMQAQTTEKIRGVNVSATAPTANQLMKYNSVVSAWEPGNVTLTKTDVGLANVDNTTDLLKPVSTATQAAIDAEAARATTAEGTKIAKIDAFAGDVAGVYTATTVGKIQGTAVSATAPTNGQVLTYNGTTWAPTTPSGGTPDATTIAKGTVRLAGDLAGTAAFPAIAANAVTSAKIMDGSILVDDLATDAVETAKIKDANVTLPKMANLAATTLIGNSAVAAAAPEAVSVSNGLTLASSAIKLGGTLTGATTINQNNNDLTFTTGSGRTIANGTYEGKGAVYQKLRIYTGTAAGFTMNADDYIVIIRVVGAVTMEMLPAPSSCPGRVVCIRNDSVNAGGGGTYTYGTYQPVNNTTILQGRGVMVASDGTQWVLIAGL